MKKNKYRWVIATTLGLLSIAIVFMFVEVSATNPGADGRITIVVTDKEREGVKTEMRGLLEAVQAIIVANNAGDLNTVAVAARKVGKSSLRPHSPEFADKLPLSFRKLGMDTHLRFDALALDTEQFESMTHVSQQLGELMGNCVACHAAYRLTTSESP
ncbi:MAG: hypothetical protein DRR15_12460 [Gammaproteobacteria bacterium]|nr:MAG: hypothetical protein DRR15_12460 [Gammaproteobacteria bacterium]